MRSFKIIFIIYLSVFAYNPSFSQYTEDEKLDEQNDFGALFNIEIEDSIIQEKILSGYYPDYSTLETPILGWSKDGKIAFIYYWEPKEPVGTLAKLMIMDLKKEEELLVLALFDGSSIYTENISLFRKEMRKNKINYNRTKICQFPAYFNTDTLIAEIENKMLCIVKKSTNRKQDIMRLDDRFSLSGYAISPYEKRMAIYYNMGCGVTISEIAQFDSYSTFLGVDLKKGFKKKKASIKK